MARDTVYILGWWLDQVCYVRAKARVGSQGWWLGFGVG